MKSKFRNQNSEEPQILSMQFRDIQSFGHASGWNLDFRQLEPGPVDIAAKTLLGSNVGILRIKIDRSFHQKGVAPKGALTFGAPIEGFKDWYGSRTQRYQIINFNDPSGFDSVTGNEFAGFTFTFGLDYLEDTADKLRITVPDWVYQPLPGSSIRPSEKTKRIHGVLSRILEKNHGSSPADAEMELLTKFLEATVPESDTVVAQKGMTRSRAISIAMDYIDGHERDAISVADLCQDVGVSIRTLDRAFKEKFDVTPKTYIRNKRLTGARNDLLDKEKSESVTEIASHWGFSHLSQFANDYKNLFGELPSLSISRRQKS